MRTQLGRSVLEDVRFPGVTAVEIVTACSWSIQEQAALECIQ